MITQTLKGGFVFTRAVWLLAITLICAAGAQAATATKSASGTDLTGGTASVWSGGSGANGSPTSADIATWSSGSLGGTTLTLGSSASWGGIAMTAATADPTIPAPGPLTLGSSGIDLSASANNLTINAPVTLGASQTWNVGGKTLTIGGIISGSTFGITKSGSGTLNLSGANTFSGGITLSGGTLGITASDSVLGTGSLTVSASSTLAQSTSGGGNRTLANSIILNTGQTLTYNDGYGNITNNGVISGAGNISMSGGPGFSTILNNINTYTGTTTAGDGGHTHILVIGASGQLGSGSYANTISIPSSGTLNYGSSLNQTLSGVISGAGVLIMSGSGKLTLSGANTYSGGTTISGGILNAGIAQNGTTSGPLGASGNIVFGGGTLQFSSASAAWDPSSRIATGTSTSAIKIDANGQAVTLGTALTSSQSGGLTLSDTAGGGKLTLNATEAYTGATTVNAGTLLVGSSGSLPSGSAVTVASGATLGGSGTINGTVNVSAGGFLAPGGVNTIGKLTLGNTLTLNGSWLTFDLTSPATAGTTYDQIAVTGALTMSGANIIKLNGISSIATGSYTLMTFAASTTSTFTFPNGTTTMTVAGSTLTLNNGTTSLTLNVANASATINDLTWKGSGGATWNSGSYWVNGGTAVSYSDPDSVTFDDTGSASATITSSGTVSPSSVIFNNNANNYTVSATIGGANTPLLKLGTGTATLSGANTYSGTTTVNAGTLALSGSGTLGSGAALTLGGGTLDLGTLTTPTVGAVSITAAASSGNTVQNGSLTGTSYAASLTTGNAIVTANLLGSGVTLTKSGAGTLTLSGNNTFSGATTLSGGTLQIGNGGTSGTLGSGTVSDPTTSSTLAFNRTDTVSSPYTISAAITGASGAVFPTIVVNSGAVQLSGTGDNSNAAADVKSGATLILGKTSSGSVHALGGVTSTVEGGGTLQLGGSGGDQIYNSSSTLSVQSGGVFDLNSQSETIATLNLAGTGISGGGALINSTTTATSTLTLGTAFNLTANASMGGAGNLTIPSVISGSSFGITKVGAGALTLSGANTFSGGTTLSAGQLNINNGGSSSVNSAIGTGTLTISGGTIDNTSAADVTFQPAIAQNWNGDFTYAGSVHNLNLGTGAVTPSATRQVTVSANTLTVGGAISGGAVGLTKAGAGTLTLSGANTYSGGLTVNNGTVSFASDGTSGGQPLGAYPGSVSAANVTLNGGGLLDTTSTTIAANRGITLGASGGTLDASASQTLAVNSIIAGTGALTKGANTGALTLSGANTYSGGTTLSAGQLNINNGGSSSANSAIGTGTLTISGGTIDNTSGSAITLLPNNVQNWNGDFTFLGLAGGTHDLNLGTGAVTLGASRQVTVNAGTLTVGGAIGGGAVGLTKAGGGTLALSGANTYTGTTTVSAGTLQNGSATSFTSKGTLALAGTSVFDLNGNPASFTDISSSVNTATITDNSGSAGTTTFSLSIQSSTDSALVKDGSTRVVAVNVANANSANPPFVLSSQNTFSGGLTLMNNASGTRINVNGAVTTTGSAGNITSSPFGRGTITIGQAATDKAQLFLSNVANNSIANAITINTALGTDLSGGIRMDTTGNTLSGAINANLADANFNSGGSGSVTLTGAISGSSGLNLAPTSSHTIGVTLNNANNTYAGNTTIGTGGTLTLGASEQIPNGTGKGNVSLTGTLNLNGFNETINGLTGAGTVDGVSGSPLFTLGDNNANGNTFSGVIKNTAGALALTKIGSGTQTFSGANTYSGATTISGGTLDLQNQNAVQNSTLTMSGGSLVFDSSVSGNAFTFGGLAASTSGTGYNIALQNNAGSPAAVALTVGGNNANTTYAGILSSSGSLTKAGTGTLTLSAANTYSGATTLSAGTLQLQNASALANSALTMNSGTTLSLLANAGTTFSPASVTEGSSGTVNYNYYVANNGSGTGNTLILANMASQFGPASTTDTFTLTGANNYTLQIGTGASGNGTLNIWNNTTLNANTAGVTLSIPGGLHNNYYNASYSLTFTGAGNISVGPLTDYDSSHYFNPTFGGSGTITLNGANTFGAGSGTISSTGTLALNNNGAFTGLSTLALNSAVTLENSSGGTVTIAGTPAQTWSSDFTFGSANTTGALNLGTGTVALGATRQVTVNNSTYGLTVGGVISGNTYGLTKTGPGTLTLSGANTYNGLTTISGGTLKAGVASVANTSGAFGNNSAVLLANAASTVMDITGFNTQIGSLTGGGATGGNVTLGAATLSVGGDNNSPAAYAGVISGTGSLTKIGSGTLKLSGANTYTGETVFNAGIINVASLTTYANEAASGSPLGGRTAAQDTTSTIGLHFTGGTLQYTGSGAQTTDRYIRVLAGISAIIDASGATSADTVTFSQSAAPINFWDSPGARSVTLTGANTGNNTFALNIPDQGSSAKTSLIKNGNGTWDMTNPHNSDSTPYTTGNYGGYTGGTTISGGTLGFASAALGASGTIEFTGSATLRWDGGNTQDLSSRLKIDDGITATMDTGVNTVPFASSLTVGSAKTGALTKAGSGTLTLSGANTYTGATTINNGTVVGVVNGSVASAVTVAATTGNTAKLGVSITDITKQWTCSALTVNNGGTSSGLDFNFGSLIPSTSLAPLKVTGAATFTTTPTITVEINNNSIGGSGTVYPLMTWSGSSVTPPSVTVTAPRAVTAHTTVTGTSPNYTLNLVIDSTKEPLTWTSGGTGTWNITDTGNWKDSGGTATAYSEATLPGDQVQFTDANISVDTTVTLNSTVTPTSVTANNSTYNYTITGSGTIAGSATTLTKSGTKTLTLATTNTYGGGSTVNNGTVSIASDGTGASNPLGTYPGSVSAANVTLNGGGLLDTTTATISANRGITLGANGGTLDASASQTFSIASIITGSGSLTKGANSGTLILSGANTFSGGLTVSNGTVSFASDGSTGGTGYPLGVYPASTKANSVTLNGGGLLDTTTATISANRGITLGANGGTLDASASQTLSIASIITGSGSLTKGANSGTLTLSGVNTYTGATAVSAGILTIDTTGVLGGGASGTAITINGGTLTDNSTVATTGGIAGTSSLTISSGTANLNTANNYSGATSVTGTLLAADANAFKNSAVTLNNGATLQLRNNSPTSFSSSGVVTVAGSANASVTFDVNNNGLSTPNTLTLANGISSTQPSSGDLANTYTTTINVTGGNSYTLALPTVTYTCGASYGSGGTRSYVAYFNPTSANVSLGNVSLNGTGSRIGLSLTLGGTSVGNFVTGAISSSAGQNRSVTKNGTGTWTLSGANTYSGGTTISSGALQVQNTTGSGTGTGSVSVNGGTLGGNGIISGAVTVANNSISVLYPHNSGGGTLTLGGNLIFSGSSSGVKFDVSTAYNGANDKVVLNGSSSVLTCGSASIGINRADNSNLDTTQPYVLFDASSSGAATPISGSFNTAPTWPGSTPANSAGFKVYPDSTGKQILLGVAANLVVTTVPASTVAGQNMGNVVVQLQDANGNAVPLSGVSVSLALSSGSFASGTTTKTTDSTGKATFNDLVINTVGSYTVTASASGYTTSPPSSSFNITPASASQLVFTTQPPAYTMAGVAFAPQPVVKIEDAFGNVVTSGSDATTNVALTLTAGAGALGGTANMNAVAGVADFTGSGLNISSAGADKVLTATATLTTPGQVTTTTSPAFAILNTAIWTNTVSGLWNTAGNWTNNVIATGSGNTADFSQVDITTDTTVSLNSTWIIGNLIFGNTDVSPAANWIVDNNGNSANTLTLAGTTPSITVNDLGAGKNVTINAVVAGTAGLTKSGTGTLTLSGANTYTGNTIISAGTLALTNSGSLTAGSSVSLAAGATFDVSGLGASAVYALGSSAGLTASGAASAAMIAGGSTGTVDLGSRPVTLNYDGLHPALTLSQGTLKLNGNAFTVNGSALAAGTYPLVSQTSGNINNVATPSVTGLVIDSQHTATISVVGATMNLVVMENSTTTLARSTGSASQTYGSALTFTATIAGNGTTPGGNVIFKDGSTILATVALTSGTAAYTSYTDLKVNGGTAHSIAAYYQGDTTHNISDSSASPISQTITAKPLIVSGLAASSKIYTGTATAILTGTAALSSPEAVGSGSVSDGTPYSGDDVSVTGTPGGTFASTNAATGISVSVNSLSLSGAQAGNYSLTSLSLSADITRASVTAAVSSTANPALPAAAVQFTNALSVVAPGGGIPTGTLQFLTNGVLFDTETLDNTGTAVSGALASLPHGTNVITVVYAGDGNFFGVTNGLAPGQVINTPPRQTVHIFGTPVNTLLTIAAGTLTNLDYDADGDALAISAATNSSVNGGTVGFDGTTFTYTPATDFVGADQFTYVVSDGYLGGTITNTVKVTVRMTSGVTSVISALTPHDDGSADLRGYGIPGHFYEVQKSTDLVNWSSISTNQALPSGLILFTDLQATNQSANYRFAVHSN